MAFKTRGSAQVDKAQRRLALMKSIEENLDLGYGLTIANYTELIEQTRLTLETYNTLLPAVDEARAKLEQLERELGEVSERMLSGVVTKYGKSSVEYAKAGGKKRSSKNSTSAKTSNPTVVATAESNGSMNGSGKAIVQN